MARFYSSKIIGIIVVLLIIFALSLNSSRELIAQNSNRTFIDFMKSYVNTEISIASRLGDGSNKDLALLKEVGSDYIIVDIKPVQLRSASTEVIALHSIYSITLGDIPQIHLNR
jgi:hypothetical protein